MFSNGHGKVLLLVVLVLLGTAVPAFGAEKYTFGFQTEPGEVLYYAGEVTTDVRVPWHQSEDAGKSTLYYNSSLTTAQSDAVPLTRLEQTEVSLPNGERVRDKVTYRLYAPDFVYVEELKSAVTAGLNFFPPIAVSPGMSWTVTGDLLVPYMNATLPVSTTYSFLDVVSVGSDQVAVIKQEFSQESYEVKYLETPVELSFAGSGFLLWSLESGDYVARFVSSQITMEVPQVLGEGEMVTTVTRSEVIDGGNSLPAPTEAYIDLYLDCLLKLKQ